MSADRIGRAGWIFHVVIPREREGKESKLKTSWAGGLSSARVSAWVSDPPKLAIGERMSESRMAWHGMEYKQDCRDVAAANGHAGALLPILEDQEMRVGSGRKCWMDGARHLCAHGTFTGKVR